MTAPKQQTWKTSMFSQFSNIDSKRRRKDNEAGNPTKRIAKKQCNPETIDLGSGAESKNQPISVNREVKKWNENWIDLFAPKTSEELALHTKKRQELQEWFKNCTMHIKKSPKLCLLTGPSGSGKTAAVRTLAKENNFSIQEWINPVDQEIIHNLGDQKHEFVNSQKDAFRNFLFKASRYRSLVDTSNTNRYLVMIEDFPNFLLKEATALHEILDDYINYARSPLIFIVTDAKNRALNVSYNIFTDQVKNKFLIDHISFNSVASTIMQKSMKRFCSLMGSPSHCQHYKVPPQNILDSIIISAQGDIRNALINLHFSSLRGAPNLLTEHLKNKEVSKSSKRKMCDNKLKSVGRDESLTMMHALGRAFNPKFTEGKRFIHTPEELSETFVTEPRTFIDLLQVNYISHFRDIEYIIEAADGLSLCDIMLNEYRNDSLALTGLNVGIRSVMVSNKNSLSGWIPIKGKQRLVINKTKVPENASKFLPKYHNICSSQYVLDYETFLNVFIT